MKTLKTLAIAAAVTAISATGAFAESHKDAVPGNNSDGVYKYSVEIGTPANSMKMKKKMMHDMEPAAGDDKASATYNNQG